MNRQLVLSILLFACLAGCSEEDDSFVDPRRLPSNGTASILLNGEFRSFEPAGGISSCDPNRLSMNIGYFSEEGFPRMSLSIINFPNQVGRYIPKRKYPDQNQCELGLTYASFATWLDDGDVLGESFHLVDEAPNNELIITHYDSTLRLLEGRFQMTLAVKEQFRIDELDFPDTLHITYGTFSMKLNPPEE